MSSAISPTSPSLERTHRKQKRPSTLLIDSFAADLRREFPGATGFSAQNVWRMRQFYILHTQSEFLSQVVRESKKAGQSAPSDEVLSHHVREMVSAVPWGHHANALLRVEDLKGKLPTQKQLADIVRAELEEGK
ncbi:MAG: DUF1016 N-terminal domain-containing protein [Terrimicrobiaceae bacterium]